MSDSSFATKADLEALEVKLVARQDAYELKCETDRKRLDGKIDDVQSEIVACRKDIKRLDGKMDGQNLILDRLDKLFGGVLATPRNRLIAQTLFAAFMMYLLHWFSDHGVKF